ncbi:MAG TPA: NTP transferase domain-containing protein, partial [Thermoanaerobaculia bacterium]|nr:NTP transferase domain-containing protein [Thermoanaerobaculia bacterium]
TLLAAGGESLPARAARRLAAVCAEVAVADRGRRLLPGLPSLPDGPGRGPAAGILGAAEVYPGRRLLVLACDLPRVPEGLLAALAQSQEPDWVVPRWGEGLEPLCALYGPAALAALNRRVARGLFALHRLAEEDLAVRILEGEDLARFGDPEEIFLNLNAPGDWERYVASDSISRRKS